MASVDLQDFFRLVGSRDTDLAVVARMLDDHPDLVAARSGKLWTALHYAAAGRCGEMLKLLLARGAEVQAAGEQQETPLHLAVADEVVGPLLVAGADPRVCDRSGTTPILFALWEGDRWLAYVLKRWAREHPQGNAPSYSADREAGSHRVDPLAQLDPSQSREAEPPAGESQLEKFCRATLQEDGITVDRMWKADPALVNARGPNGRTPLHMAAGLFDECMTRILLQRGADVHARGADGETPLHLALRAPVIQFLLDAGADPAVPDSLGLSAQDLARLDNDKDCVALLQTRVKEDALP